MSKFRPFFFVAAVAVFVTVAASLVWPQLSASRAAPAIVPTLVPSLTSTPAPTQTPAPTKTIFVFPTLAGATSPASTEALTPSSVPSDTPVPPAPTLSDTPAPSVAPAETLPPLATVSDVETAVTYTVMISDVYGRREPVMDSSLYQPLERGQSYTVTAQSSDGIWLSLALPKLDQTVWVPAAFGLTYGSRQAVPVASPAGTLDTEPVTLTVELSPPVDYAYLSTIGARARDIYRYGLLLGNSPHAFMKIGDCQTIYPFFLSAFDNPKSYHLGSAYAYLQDTIHQFSGSFSRNSAAAQTGFGTATVLDPQWANPTVCRPGESPLVCEYRTMRPSLALISLGTNDIWQPDDRHEKNMRQIIDYLVHQGVVPILSTKADNVEGDGSFNQLMVQLAHDDQLPLWDFWQVTRGLPQYGLVDTYHLSWGPADFDDPKNMQLGWPWRNLTALQALDAVWRTVR